MATALVCAGPEWVQGARQLLTPYTYGDEPRPAALAGSALAGVGALAMVERWLRRRSVPLAVSGVILLGLVASVAGTAGSAPTRSVDAANRAILEIGGAIERAMAEVLQREGEVPPPGRAWEDALARVATAPSVVQRRPWGRWPYQVLGARSPGEGSVARPGTFWVWVSADGASFDLVPVGFGADGQAAALRDERGLPLVLRVVFNPDL